MTSPGQDSKDLKSPANKLPPNTGYTQGEHSQRKICATHQVEFCHTKNCPDLHPKTCPDWLSFKRGCKLSKKKCSLQHSTICDGSWNTLTCFNKACNKRHLAQTIRNPSLLHGPQNVKYSSQSPMAPANTDHQSNRQQRPQTRPRRPQPENRWQLPPPPEDWSGNRKSFAPHSGYYSQNFPAL